MKDVLKGTLHTVELFALAVAGIAIGNIPLGVALVAVATIPASKLMDDVRGNDAKNSIFSVTRSGHIHQNTLAKPLKVVSLLSSKNKQEKFTEEALNMFTEIKEKDKNGQKKKYNTRSQILTLSLLKRLQRHGYIENLEYEKDGESSLFVEKLLMGNFKDLFKGKKYPMFQISFNLTDKPRNKDELMELAGLKKKPNPDGSTINTGTAATNTNTNSMATPVKEAKPVGPEVTVTPEKSNDLASKKEQLLDMKAELLAAKEMQPKENNETKSATK